MREEKLSYLLNRFTYRRQIWHIVESCKYASIAREIFSPQTILWLILQRNAGKSAIFGRFPAEACSFVAENVNDNEGFWGWATILWRQKLQFAVATLQKSNAFLYLLVTSR